MQAAITLITQLVVDLLQESQPELSARLKQRLNSVLQKRGFDRFDEKAFGSKRFTDFLKKHLGESLTLTPPAGPGDVLVSLKDLAVDATIAVGLQQSEPVIAPEKIVVRPDVWQAFINQDRERRRYFSRVDHKVLHYRNGTPADVKAAIESAPANYIEIVPIAEATQVEWLRAFLSKNPPNSRIAMVIQHLLEEDTGGVMFDSIAKILGAKDGEIWRAQRVNRIYEHIVNWCGEHGIDSTAISHPSKQHSVMEPTSIKPPGDLPAPVRKQALAILESMSDDDIAQIVLPILVSTVLVKARL
ncbi:hypothetical protein SAMN05192549_1234 [Duganella sacchari]|uniref:HTH OST-type domain-containing protein n=1 Tax=Duganella sacchari TaxID=551987 RepID=A0A1M7REE3_9BURK|nr:hypothetical protein [Duganella sacchari]SHN44551.1 hypothetical protein SAMN05192549_1234 [Duganella sacchari]